MKAIKKAQLLTKGLKSDKDKIAAIYNYIVPNYKYDFSKFNNIDKLPNPYIPVIDKTYDEQKGICYDYSSLFASMLRSVNIPVKLDMGYSKNVKEYHAWNEVYSSDLKKWIIVDTTYDSQIKLANLKYSMAKDSKLYSVVKSY
jgi:transglutaminase-like putative cysteine protease